MMDENTVHDGPLALAAAWLGFRGFSEALEKLFGL